MPQGTTRTIHFFKPGYVDTKGAVQSADEGFFAELHNHVRTLMAEDEDRLLLPFRSNSFVGYAGEVASPAVKYLYVGRVRPQADHPDVRDAKSGGLKPLELAGSQLVEPAYICPVAGTKYLALTKSSGGPSWSAIEHWTTAVSGVGHDGLSIELEPFTRMDQTERLQRSMHVKRLNLTVAAGDETIQQQRGEIAQSIQQLQKMGAGSVAVEVVMSFGNATPNEAVARPLAEELNSMVGKVKFKKARATIIEEDEKTGDAHPAPIDFLKDSFAHLETVRHEADRPPSTSEVLHAVQGGIRAFREVLQETSSAHQ